jgi:hypothetical protein
MPRSAHVIKQVAQDRLRRTRETDEEIVIKRAAFRHNLRWHLMHVFLVKTSDKFLHSTISDSNDVALDASGSFL